MKFQNKIIFEYNDVGSMCEHLSDKLSEIKPNLIVGITRGGLVPALHLSHSLDRPMSTIKWQTRDDQVNEVDPKILQAIAHGDIVVFVDDINDSGRTFAEISAAYGGPAPNVKFVSMVEKLGSLHRSDITALRFDDVRWVQFPWERD